MTQTTPHHKPEPPPSPFLTRDAQVAFRQEVEQVRANLHRYCSRMLGSSLDGEDVVQETLAATFFRLAKLDTSKPMAPLLFHIANNKCIDLIRRRRFEAGDLDPEADWSGDVNHPLDSAEAKAILGEEADLAMRRLVLWLPPRERSCVLLKDVLEHSIADISAIMGCSEGAVKAALHRGRGKLAAMREKPPENARPEKKLDPTERAVLEQYVDRFNRRDWAALTELLADDLRLDVVGELEDVGKDVLLEAYTGNYSRLDGSWRLVLGTVDGEPAILVRRRLAQDADEVVSWPIRVEVNDGRVARVRDYVLCDALTDARLAELIVE